MVNKVNFPVINTLRAIAAISVCLLHLIRLHEGVNFFDHSSAIYRVADYGRYGVQVFFVISGVVIPLAMIKGNFRYSLFGKFMLKRMIRIEPPYLLSILVYLAYVTVRNNYTHKATSEIPTIHNLLLHIGYLIPFFKGELWFNIVFWTLGVEFQFYLLISFLFPLLFSHGIAVRSISYGIIYLLAILFQSGDWFILTWMPVFMIGISYISYYLGKIKRREYWAITILSGFFCCYLHNWSTLFAAIGTILIIGQFAGFKSRIGNFLGAISYSLYLTHMSFPMGIMDLLIKHVSTTFTRILVVLFGVAVSILFAYFFYLVIERPSKKYASKIVL